MIRLTPFWVLPTLAAFLLGSSVPAEAQLLPPDAVPGGRGAPAPGSQSVWVLVELDGPPAAQVYAELLSRCDTPRDRKRATDAARDWALRLVEVQTRVINAMSAQEPGITVLFQAQRVLNAVAVRVKRRAVPVIRALDGVRDVRSIPAVSLQTATTVPFIGVPAAWAGTGLTGRGVSIGIIDSGLDYLHTGFGGSGRA